MTELMSFEEFLKENEKTAKTYARQYVEREYRRKYREEAKKKNITVMRVPGYSPEAVAEHAMALALASSRRIHKSYIKVRENNFSLTGLTGTNLHGKIAGIIGTGKIGATMCRICRGSVTDSG